MWLGILSGQINSKSCVASTPFIAEALTIKFSFIWVFNLTPFSSFCKVLYLFCSKDFLRIFKKYVIKVRSEIKETTFWDGHFRTLSGHSVANYICIFHKTEVLTVILMCLLSLNLNWIKSYDIILVEIIFFHASF